MVVFKTGGTMSQQPDDKMDSLKKILDELTGTLDKTVLGAVLVNFSSLYKKEELADIIAKQTGLDPKFILIQINESMKVFWENYLTVIAQG